MPSNVAQTVGVDISKATLDVYLHPQAIARQFPNTMAGVVDLLSWLGQRPIHRVIFEPTGAYHHRLERQLGNAGVPMVKVNPLQARRFAEAIGQRAKTDAVDAAMLARFGALDALQVRPMVSQTLSDMKELLVPRRGLVKDRVAASNRNHTHRAPLLKRLADQRLRQVERQIAAIDAALRALCQADVELKARLEILVSIPAIGEATALAMLIEMPELGAMDNKCAASLAGLAPVARDSGQHSGKRFIRAGRAHLRQALYMPALVAIRFNADMKAKYQALVAAGKPPKVAITAVMRKLLILANALLREHRNWTPKPA
ncbi:IS110 family transposase [Roseomonas nepalensis]|uniref:IS110 family transposase n=1 Tax=Muricoccus nepalensis TaxID=1854500 RepID=A0A502EQ33_9PROT|nr:IS110 family transposase [Roseomonas nepalensis]TPG39915.1 IS110 family transposase [Roseomonas nepalensis]